LAPKKRVRSIHDIDLRALKKAGIKGIITDLDNTLVKTRATHADQQVTAWFKRLKDEGFKVVIVSNNTYKRVSSFSDPLGIPFVHGARKPTPLGFRKSLEVLGLLPSETAVIGDQILTDVYGGNRLGMYTILVQPVTLEGEKWVTKVNRTFEKFAIRRMRKKGIFPKEDA
jgi:HAD superfamily phosphatase (TIGR01668 family)